MAGFTYDDAAHLLRRLGFGGPPGEINDLATRGREGAVDYLINYESIDNKAMDDALAAAQLIEARILNSFSAQTWWFARMILTRRLGPLNTSPEIVRALTSYLASDDDGNQIDFVVNDSTVDKNVRGLLRLVPARKEISQRFFAHLGLCIS